MKEIWRKIPDIPSNYEVSNTGYVRKELLGGGYEILNRPLSGEYYTVCFEGKQFTIHRLVAAAFLPNKDSSRYKIVKFKDGNKLNPVSENLEWTTVSEANENKYRLKADHLLVQCVETAQTFSTYIAAAAYFNFPKTALASAVKDGHACFGKHFRYVSKSELEESEPIYYISTRELIELSKASADVSVVKSYIDAKVER